MKCLECKTDGMRPVPGEDGLFFCPKCGYRVRVIKLTLKQLKDLGKDAYLDGRHWNHGGGLNRG